MFRLQAKVTQIRTAQFTWNSLFSSSDLGHFYMWSNFVTGGIFFLNAKFGIHVTLTPLQSDHRHNFFANGNREQWVQANLTLSPPPCYYWLNNSLSYT